MDQNATGARITTNWAPSAVNIRYVTALVVDIAELLWLFVCMARCICHNLFWPRTSWPHFTDICENNTRKFISWLAGSTFHVTLFAVMRHVPVFCLFSGRRAETFDLLKRFWF